MIKPWTTRLRSDVLGVKGKRLGVEQVEGEQYASLFELESTPRPSTLTISQSQQKCEEKVCIK